MCFLSCFVGRNLAIILLDLELVLRTMKKNASLLFFLLSTNN
uniref:Uncharacterized protein n=1 Tax=Rhizophora mucronata TaxID=61149 RepID=A0A2P2L2T4_RHIMU